ncbi:MAG: ABC transporter permease [Anaerolineales bacterium]|nr:ABC transporter permease [Anaerolineales bacterium]
MTNDRMTNGQTKNDAAEEGTLGVVLASKAEDRVSVASNWKLVWWRFRKNKLALVSALVLIMFYIVVLVPDFFATQDPEATEARLAFIPTQGLNLFDGTNFSPWVPAVVGKRNPVTLRMEFKIDETKKVPIRFFTEGFKYKVLGLFETNLHLIGPQDPKSADWLYLFGTDRLGRDQWSRMMYGTRTSMTVGLVSVILSVIFGVLLGGISGYFGGWPDLIIQRLIELLQSLPTIPIWLAMTAALPQDWRPDQVFFAITIILAFIGWTTLGREVRGRFLSLREEDFVLAADLAGCSRFRIITRHMVPSFMSHIIASSTLAIPVMIISETSLSFLGLGIRPPAISWGVLLQEAQNIQTLALAPWLLAPGLAVIVAVLAFNLVGDGLRDAADPYGH